jgi:hypothetical protein
MTRYTQSLRRWLTAGNYRCPRTNLELVDAQVHLSYTHMFYVCLQQPLLHIAIQHAIWVQLLYIECILN